MGSKKNRKTNRPAPVGQTQKQSAGGAPWPLIAIAVAAVAGAGIFMTSRSSAPEPSPATTELPTQAATAAPAASPAGTPAPAASSVSSTPFTAAEPNDLPMPPLPYTSQMSGSPEEVRQAYVFAAQNPGVLEYVPCYCGCEYDGHRSNVDCFVGSRAANGAVESWDTHGMTWQVCLGVARDAMQMHALGASVSDIQSAVITKYAAIYPSSTPTPAVPQ